MPEYKQCTTIGSFDSALMEFLYFLFVMVMSLILPFIIMLYSYLVIIWVISRSGHLTFSRGGNGFDESGSL